MMRHYREIRVLYQVTIKMNHYTFKLSLMNMRLLTSRKSNRIYTRVSRILMQAKYDLSSYTEWKCIKLLKFA